MEKVNVSKEEVQTLLADANEFLATFDDCIKHLEKRFIFFLKRSGRNPSGVTLILQKSTRGYCQKEKN